MDGIDLIIRTAGEENAGDCTKEMGMQTGTHKHLLEISQDKSSTSQDHFSFTKTVEG